ncbi:MAG: major capsid protein [Sedimentisphaerales bacterium]
MSTTLDVVLGTRNLIGVIEAIKPGSGASDLLPTAFLVPTKTIEGNSGDYDKVDGNRETARLIQYGSPSRARNLQGVSKIGVKLLHSFEHVNLDPSVLVNLKDPNDFRQDIGQREVSRQLLAFKSYFTNLRAGAVFSALSTGKIYFDINGNLLPSASNAYTTVDFGIPAGNKDQLDALGTGSIISAKWSTASTDISAQVENIKTAAMALTGYPIRHAFYGKSILGYFATNSGLKDCLTQNQDFSKSVGKGSIPDGLLGLSWHPMSEAYSQLASGGKFWWPDDAVVFTPEPSSDWWEVLEGTTPIPSNLNVVGADNAWGAVQLAKGIFSYAQIQNDPCLIRLFAGDTFISLLKVPKAVFIADVDF